LCGCSSAVERQLPKLNVEGSTPFTRSIFLVAFIRLETVSIMRIDDRLDSLATDAGCDYFGVADLSSAQPTVADQGGSLVQGYPYAISVGIAVPGSIVDQLPNRSNPAVAVAYRHHSYQVINQRLDLLTSRIAGSLQKEGHRALPVSASERYDNERICAVFSHKLAAHLAGLGWIGKSCLLITPRAGPRVRWASVLTDAPLKSTGQPMPEKCGSCSECVDICPADAFTGQPFHEDEPRSVRYDARKCQEYHAVAEETIGHRVCGLCVYVCPHGRKV
jgi:epoxyqueuosine reductase